MNVCEGQALLGRVAYKDTGKLPEKDRVYLVIKVTQTNVVLLNVSSVAGKEHKLTFPANYHIKNFNPPFMRDSFVKLDSAVTVSASQLSCFHVLHGGDSLNIAELQIIKEKCNS